MDLSRPNPLATPRCCSVCGRNLDAPTTGSPLPVCRASECQTVLDQQIRMAPLQFQAYLALQRFRLRQRAAGTTAFESRAHRRQRREERENQRILAELVAARQPLAGQEDVHLMGIPSGARALVSVPRGRIEAYRAHLEAILASAAEGPDEARDRQHHLSERMRRDVDRRLARDPAMRSIGEALCRQCRGGCCVGGGDHAYLNPFVIRRFLAQAPKGGAAGLLRRYLQSVPRSSVDGSCIHHGAGGCTLPRDLRSDNCNAFFCDALRGYHKRRGSGARAPVLAIQRDYDYWRRPQARSARVVAVVLVDLSGNVRPLASAPASIADAGKNAADAQATADDAASRRDSSDCRRTMKARSRSG